MDSVTGTFCGDATTDEEAPFAFSADCEDEEFESGAAGTTPVFTSVAEGNMGPDPILNADHPFPVRTDFVGPGAPTFWANPNGRQNGWLNPAVDLAGEFEDDDNLNGWLVDGDDDDGVGGLHPLDSVRHVRPRDRGSSVGGDAV